jgi:hypothetical protein
VIQIALYIPVAFVVCVVLAALREDAPMAVLRVATKNFLILSLVLAAGSAAIFAMSAFL